MGLLLCGYLGQKRYSYHTEYSSHPLVLLHERHRAGKGVVEPLAAGDTWVSLSAADER
jgi:hypothetical protein